MFSHANDSAQGLMIGLWSGRSNTPADFDLCLEALARSERDAVGQSKGGATIIVSDAETPTPGALDRKRIADLWSSGRAPHSLAIVSTSRLVRGVMTAINWFAPPTHQRPQTFFGTFDEALAWMEQRRPGCSARMRDLYRDARAQAQSPSKATG